MSEIVRQKNTVGISSIRVANNRYIFVVRIVIFFLFHKSIDQVFVHFTTSQNSSRKSNNILDKG